MLQSPLFRKILLAFLLLAVVSLGLDLISGHQLTLLTQEQESVARRSYEILRMTEELRVKRLNMDAAGDDYFYTGEPRFRERYDQARAAFLTAIASTRELLRDQPEETAFLAELEKGVATWETEAVHPAFEARGHYAPGQIPPRDLLARFPRGVTSPRLEEMQKQTLAFEERQRIRAEQARLKLQEHAWQARGLLWTFGLLTGLLALVVGFIIATNVSRSVQELVRGTQKISAGEYTEVPIHGDDEVAALARAFNQMAAAVRGRETQLRDYTEQQRTQAEALSKTLDQQTSRFETVLNTIIDGVLMVDAEGKILMCNPKACEIFGLTSEEMTRLHLVDLMERFRSLVVNPQELDAKITALNANPGSSEEVTFEFKDPGYGAIRLYSVPLYGSDGRLLGRVATSLDISKDREIDRLKREFISTVSHELRTPLTSIKGSLGLISGGAVGQITPDMRELLQIAQNNTERLIRLINDILDVFKIESGRIRLRPAPTAINECIQRAMAATEAYAGKMRIRLEADVPEDLPNVLADPQRVDQVLINLLSNAVKFSPPGETVSVAARVTPPAHGETSAQVGRAWVQVAVRDRGKGIPQPFLQKIFEKFHQVDSSPTRQYGGTGLGLTISRAIIEQHGGRIWVESELGVGSTFFFTLPVLDQGPTSSKSAGLSELEARRSEVEEANVHQKNPVG